MSEEESRFDGIFMTVLQQKKSIGSFFEAVFGFLRRQSDFFTDQKNAEQVITGECKKQYDRWVLDRANKEKEESAKAEKEAARKRAKEQQASQAQQAQQQQAQPVQQTPPAAQQVQVAEPVKPTSEEGEKKDDDEKAPVGNGGRTEKYIWTQTLEEVTIFVPIPEGLRAKQLTVSIKSERLFVGINGQSPPLIDGEFYEKVHADGTIWTITDGTIQDYKGRYIHITIEKWKNQMHWWDCVVKGDPKINTQKINPEPSRLDELEGETRGTVEKMMFDMRQKQAGLPTSDELDKKNKLAEFMKAHPEMDFSKCKFN